MIPCVSWDGIVYFLKLKHFIKGLLNNNLIIVSFTYIRNVIILDNPIESTNYINQLYWWRVYVNSIIGVQLIGE